MPNHLPACFTHFSQSLAHVNLPDKFTFPFCYQPSEISKIAVAELQAMFLQNEQLNTSSQGRMFGVLVVKDNNENLGYLAAISGTHANLDQSEDMPVNFVPAIFQGFESGHTYLDQQVKINAITQEILQLEQSETFATLKSQLSSLNSHATEAITAFQQTMTRNRQHRKHKRELLALAESSRSLDADDIKQHSIQLSRESVQDKKALTALKAQWQERIAGAKKECQQIEDTLVQLKKARRKLSAKLQRILFKQYQLLNINGKVADLLTLFRDTPFPTPPAGAGDCAAPKLLQYAFQHKLMPISMAEFWWGSSPQSEIRKHGLFYPACQGKCQPILTHMLSGMQVDDNPMLINPAEKLALSIAYKDEHIVVVNKPSGLLSVPGKTISDSVFTRIKAQFPNASGPMIVHRLDMATSGLIILSLNERAHKGLQKQFINKEITKQYVAIVDGEVTGSSGTITLPLRGDLNDRPRQLVCHEHGKPAKTEWQLIDVKNGKSRLRLSPITGRTHQLRVHCAHPSGLNMPITGDGLYGTNDTRLHLHAERLSFKHPVTQQPMQLCVEPAF